MSPAAIVVVLRATNRFASLHDRAKRKIQRRSATHSRIELLNLGRGAAGKRPFSTMLSTLLQPIIKTQQVVANGLARRCLWVFEKLSFNVHKLFVKYIPFTIPVITHADDKGKGNGRFSSIFHNNSSLDNSITSANPEHGCRPVFSSEFLTMHYALLSADVRVRDSNRNRWLGNDWPMGAASGGEEPVKKRPFPQRLVLFTLFFTLSYGRLKLYFPQF